MLFFYTNARIAYIYDTISDAEYYILRLIVFVTCVSAYEMYMYVFTRGRLPIMRISYVIHSLVHPRTTESCITTYDERARPQGG